ncbi:hypothetical protein ACJJIU_10020 [Microbulbifer sp. CnH-101-E]|uniref:hypothetical protein n=1 Tax=unclassified Microbulbifer TaxID=2619833 RepID=UPI004039531D
MSIPKKGSRKIEVEGKAFRWTIRKKPTYSQATSPDHGLKAAVEKYENPASILNINFQVPRNDSWESLGKVEIGPRHIAQCIKEALSSGWDPDAKAVNHEVNHHIT